MQRIEAKSTDMCEHACCVLNSNFHVTAKGRAMLLAELGDTLTIGFIRVFCVWIIFLVLAKKFLASNPEVKDAAKKAASAKATKLIKKWLK